MWRHQRRMAVRRETRARRSRRGIQEALEHLDHAERHITDQEPRPQHRPHPRRLLDPRRPRQPGRALPSRRPRVPRPPRRVVLRRRALRDHGPARRAGGAVPQPAVHGPRRGVPGLLHGRELRARVQVPRVDGGAHPHEPQLPQRRRARGHERARPRQRLRVPGRGHDREFLPQGVEPHPRPREQAQRHPEQPLTHSDDGKHPPSPPPKKPLSR